MNNNTTNSNYKARVEQLRKDEQKQYLKLKKASNLLGVMAVLSLAGFFGVTKFFDSTFLFALTAGVGAVSFGGQTWAIYHFLKYLSVGVEENSPEYGERYYIYRRLLGVAVGGAILMTFSFLFIVIFGIIGK